MKNTIIKSILMSGLLIFGGIGLMCSCEDHSGHIESSGSGGMNVKDEILFETNTSYSLNVKASTKPELRCDADWLKIGEVRNITTGIYTTELTAEVNATGETRRTTIYVTAGNETSEVAVSQLSVDVVEIKGITPGETLDPAGGAFEITYVSTATPAMNLPEWIKVADTRALEEGTLRLAYLPNTTGGERTGMIVLAVGKDAVANATVRQPSL